MAVGPLHEQLQPFLSLTLAKIGQPPPATPLADCLDGIVAMCVADNAENSDATSDFEQDAEEEIGPDLWVKALTYRRKVQPAWSRDATVLDDQNHLAVAVLWREHLALHVTDPKVKGRILTALRVARNPELPLTWLFAIPRATLSSAFVAGGDARILWLGGTHRRTSTRADAKILSGMSLDDALDPFDDGSFYWSAARSRSKALDLTIGVSPKASRIWIGETRAIEDFAEQASKVIDALLDTHISKDEPFRYLATPLQAVPVGAVNKAYDLSIQPPELDPDEGDPEKARALAALIDEAAFSVTGSDASADCAVELLLNGKKVGSLTLKVNVATDGTVKFKAEGVVATGVRPDDFNRLRQELIRGQGVNIRYDSGHSISGKQVFTTQRGRIDFRQFDARDFSTFDVDQEKPDNLNEIGKHKSLFCWVQQKLDGWLACDDGANEKADFIRLHKENGRWVLSLIHVKGANSKKEGRRISVAAYEVVTAQAVKNLLWLDKQRLIEGVEASARAANYFWEDGAPKTKDAFITALKTLGDDFDRRVVIVQPHVTTKAYVAAFKAKNGINRLRLEQLSTLLAGAWRSCNGLGAELQVIWSDQV